MLVFLARHGESVAKQLGYRQNPQMPLNQNGEIQAELLAKKVLKENIGFIITSNFLRSLQTARIVSKITGKPLKISKLIHDQKKDTFLYKERIGSRLDLAYKKELSKNWGDFNWKYKNKGESLYEVIKRVALFKRLLSKRFPNQKILIITHEIVISCFIACCVFEDEILSETSKSFIINFKSDYGLLSLVEFKNGKWRHVY